MRMPKQQPVAEDPQLAIQRQQAEQNKIAEITKMVSSQTDQMARQFGVASVMSGGSMRAPLLGL